MSSLPALEAQRGQLLAQIDELTASLAAAQKELTRLEARLPLANDSEKVAIQGNISTLRAQIASQSSQLIRLTEQLARIDAEIAVLRAQETLPSQSTGDTVANAQKARDDAASATNPPPGPLTDADGRIVKTQETVSTNAEKFKTNSDAGTNATTRKGTSTQSIPPSTAAPGGASPNGGEFGYPNEVGGAAAPGDDNVPGDNGVRAELNRIFGSAQKLVPTPNPLDRYASYTYNVSLYIMSPVEYKKLLTTKSRNISGWQLLMQSGGAPNVGTAAEVINPAAAVNADEADVYAQQITTARSVVATQGRNQFFPLDYYIDDIVLKSLVQGRGTRASHGVFELTFKIYEPNGFTLFDRLYLATQQYTGLTQGGPKNYLAQNYLMVIKFYGYDDAGNLIVPNQSQKTGPNSDSNAVIEKWYPFQFTQIRTKIQNKVTEYDCSAACPATTINGGQARGTIPYNVELSATTVKDVLFGTAQFGATTGATDDSNRTATANQAQTAAGSRTTNTTSPRSQMRTTAQGAAAATDYRSSGEMAYPNEIPSTEAKTSTAAPAKADAAPKTLISGLVDALNKYQQDLCKAKKPGEAPIYTYPDVYEIIIEDDILKNAKINSPGEPNKAVKPMTKAQTAGEAKLGSKQRVDNNSQNKSILAGTSIVQFIEQILRTSTYITDQQLYTITSGGEIKPNGKPAQTVGWFHIGMEAQPLQYDYRRNDYAYKIIYSVSLYAITESKSDWFPDSLPRGTQKQYNYWFTGANNQVLDFTQELNALYYMIMSGPSPDRTYYTDYREFDKRAWQPRSDETDQGNKGKTFEPAANLADSIYSPADTFRARLTIVGDPDWMQQGEPVFGVGIGRGKYLAFTSDGSINFESQEPLFEILYNKPVDYDLWTGIMDPGQTNFYANRPEGKSGEARVSQIYRCFQVYSTLSRGKFTQEIEGAQVRFQTKKPMSSAESSRSDTAAARQPTNKTPARTPTLPFTDPMGTSDGAAIMAAAGTSPIQRERITSAGQVTYDQLGNPISTTPAIPAAAAQPPTSGGQAVGPASTSNPNTGGASGTNVGQPVQVNVYLNDNQVQQVVSYAELQALRQQELISPQEFSSAANRLRILQSAANNPTAASRSQIMAKENG